MSRQAQIVFVNGKFTSQATTGVQRFSRQLVRALDGNPDASRYVLLCPPGGRPPDLRRIEVRMVGPRGLPLHIWEQFVLPWFSREGYLVSLAGSAPALAQRCAVVIHDAAVFDRPDAYRQLFVLWYRALFRWLAWRRVPIATVSQFSRERLSHCLKRTASEISVIPNGCDHLDPFDSDDSILERWGLAPQRYILSVASDNPLKNLWALENAFLRARLDGVRLVIAGGRMERVFAITPTSDHSEVVRVGPAKDAELVCLYRNAAFLAYPSVYEGFGIPPLEAMRLGCPVLAAPCAALKEVLGSAAYFAQSAQVADLEIAMKQLFGDASLRRQLSSLGLEHAANYKWSDAASKLRSFIAVTIDN